MLERQLAAGVTLVRKNNSPVSQVIYASFTDAGIIRAWCARLCAPERISADVSLPPPHFIIIKPIIITLTPLRHGRRTVTAPSGHPCWQRAKRTAPPVSYTGSLRVSGATLIIHSALPDALKVSNCAWK